MRCFRKDGRLDRKGSVPAIRKYRALATLFAFVFTVPCSPYPIPSLAQGQTYHLGTKPSVEEIKSLDLSIDPQGSALPPGKGTAQEGGPIYMKKCAACHGPTGAEGPTLPGAARLWPYSSARGGYVPPTLMGGKSGMEGIWSSPTATTMWSYIRRAMPPKAEGSLSANEVYALTAWLLFRRGVISETEVMDAKTLMKVPMPNRACIPWRFSCTETAGPNSGR